MRTTQVAIGATALLALAVITARPGHSQVQGTLPAFVKKQSETPGVPDQGHANITGTMRAGDFVGYGGNLTGLNAANLTQGVLGDTHLSSNVARRDQSNTFVGPVNSFSGFVGVGRNTPVNSSELFGIGEANASGFVGTYVLGGANSKPYYGYAINGGSSAYSYLDGATGDWRLVNGGVNRLNVGNDGNVGIGTANPNSKLEVAGELRVSNSVGTPLFRVHENSQNGNGTVRLNSSTGKLNLMLDQILGNRGWIGVMDQFASYQAAMFVSSDDNGYVVADTKNFRVPNPRNMAEDIYYACVEGPEAAAYVRGTAKLVNGRAHVELPVHFTDVTVSQGMTVQLTVKSPDSKGVGYWHGSNTGFDVFELNAGKGNYEIDWEVKCVRKGHEDYQVVRPWDKDLPSLDKKAAWANRVASIQAKAAAAQKGGRP